jgi:hypothetical protein
MPFLLLFSSSPGRELDSLKVTLILSSFVEKPAFYVFYQVIGFIWISDGARICPFDIGIQAV